MSAPSRLGSRAFLGSALASVAVVVVAYANHFRNAFHFDDAHVIEENLFIRSLANIPRFFTDASTFSTLPDHQTYRPLLSLTYALDYSVGGGLDPLAFHVTQLLLHLLVGAGLFLVFRKVMDAAQPGPANILLALFAALWFCVHTGNTETVNYLSSRSDIASTLGLVGSMVAYLYLPAWRRFHLYLIPMLVGVLAKPPAVIFAPILLAYILLFEEKLSLDEILSPKVRDKVWAAVQRAMPALAAGVVAFLFVEGMNPEGQDYGGLDRVGYLRTQPWVWLHYARLFVLPVGLTADTDWGLISAWTDTRVWVGVAALLLLGWGAFWTSRQREWRPVSFGLMWFALGLLPASSIFPISEVANEHRMYLPFAGLALAATWTALRFARRSAADGIPVMWGVVGLVLLGTHVTGTVSRNRVWLNEETLWADVIVKSPDNGRAWMNHGLTQMEVGQYAAAHADFTRAAELWPYYAPVHVNLGIVTNAMGDTAAAESFFLRALELKPGYGPAHHYFGRHLIGAGRAPEAINYLRSALDIMPAYAPTRDLLLQLYYVIGSQDEVEGLAESTLEMDPGDATAAAFLMGDPPLSGTGPNPYERGVDLTSQGRHLEAGVAYRRYLEVVGADADAYLNLGWSRAQLGFDALAAIAFQQALMMRPGWDMAAQNLAWVQRRMGLTP